MRVLLFTFLLVCLSSCIFHLVFDEDSRYQVRNNLPSDLSSLILVSSEHDTSGVCMAGCDDILLPNTLSRVYSVPYTGTVKLGVKVYDSDSVFSVFHYLGVGKLIRGESTIFVIQEDLNGFPFIFVK